MEKKKYEAPLIEEAEAVQEAASAPCGPDCGSRPVQRAEVTAAQGLNLRNGPGPGFEVGAVLAEGTEVEVLPLWSEGPQGMFDCRVPGWAYVFTGSMVGWVDTGFLRMLER